MSTPLSSLHGASVTVLGTTFFIFAASCALSFSDFDSLSEEDVAENNQLAFDIAEREFGIQPVIRGEEVAAAAEPDQLLMVLYLSKFHEAFRISLANSSGQVPSCLLHLGLFPQLFPTTMIKYQFNISELPDVSYEVRMWCFSPNANKSVTRY